MALLKLVDEKKAEGLLEALLGGTKDMLGFVPNALKLYGKLPKVLSNTLATFETYRSNTNFSPGFFVSVRYCVALQKGTEYCINLNSGLLKKFGVPAELVDGAADDWRVLPLPDNEKEMMALCLKVADSPDDVSQDDIDHLKSIGWSEEDILMAADQAARMLYGGALMRSFKLDPDDFS